MIQAAIRAVERGFIPDSAVRFGIRRLCESRLKSLGADGRAEKYADTLRQSPLAIHTQAANEQHYEVPADFFRLVLGKNLKYSSAYWPKGCRSLDTAEHAALIESCAHAHLRAGQHVLELGCGWGSLTLHMARTYPASSIVALSNSASQGRFIDGAAKERGLNNVRVLTRNIADVEHLEKEFPLFDRVVSVEMFEHLRNYDQLFERISRWLKLDGKLFVHVFTHRHYSYPFESDGDDNWMGRHFFSGGQMPAHNLLPQFQKHLSLENDWLWSGEHYAKTADAWLDNLDRRSDEARAVLARTHGTADAVLWLNRWRIFFMACSELFGARRGTEWGVSHYLFRKRNAA